MKAKYNTVNNLIKATSSLLLVLIFSSCRSSIENKIADRIRQTNCDNDSTCVIHISSVTPFQWDEMVGFDGMAPLKELVDKAISQDYPHYKDYSRPIIFLYHHKIVHYENEDYGAEAPVGDQLCFLDRDSLGYYVIKRKEDAFKVRKRVGDHIYYQLFP